MGEKIHYFLFIYSSFLIFFFHFGGGLQGGLQRRVKVTRSEKTFFLLCGKKILPIFLKIKFYFNLVSGHKISCGKNCF